MNAIWNLFSLCDWSTFASELSKEKLVRVDTPEGGTCGCKVTEDVWKSAVYLGAGGPLMRDH